MTTPLRLKSELVERVWGGHQLSGDPGGPPVGEAWVIAEHNTVSGGPHGGQALTDLSARYPRELLGARATGDRFPLLIKLLDCADWLSVQVHPNDAQALALEGPGHLGKTEAWHILHAEPGARIIAGLRPGTDEDDLRSAIQAGHVMDYAQYADVQAGDTFMIPAGTVHALGPGILLYEVQQTSDLTYRIYDWDRPASAGRTLHLAQSAAVSVDRVAQAEPEPAGGPAQTLTRCPYFQLERLRPAPGELRRDTAGQSFHCLTVTQGEAAVEAGGEAFPLSRYDSLLIPAAVGPYTLRGDGEVLCSSLPGASVTG